MKTGSALTVAASTGAITLANSGNTLGSVTATGTSAGSFATKGTWEIKGDQVCRTYEQLPPGMEHLGGQRGAVVLGDQLPEQDLVQDGEPLRPAGRGRDPVPRHEMLGDLVEAQHDRWIGFGHDVVVGPVSGERSRRLSYS